jgi:hypothetical protein
VGPGSDGGPCLVEVEELAVQAAVLVEVAAGNFDSSRVGHAAYLERVEAGSRFAALASESAPSVPNAFT